MLFFNEVHDGSSGSQDHRKSIDSIKNYLKRVLYLSPTVFDFNVTGFSCIEVITNACVEF